MLHDAQTGLPNRVLLRERLEHALVRAERHATTLAVLFVDLDHFGLVNESLGHAVGDELIAAVAHRLQEALRAGDSVTRPEQDTMARLGGDELVVLCEGLAGGRSAITVAERMMAALAAPFVVADHELFVGASIGIALASAGATPDSLIRDAEAAMSQAKHGGRHRYELFDPAIRARVYDRLQRETELRHAIEEGALRVFYQPIVSLADGSPVGAEALVRWQHPTRGLILPGDFLPLAEETGLIVPLGAWVLEEVCAQLVRWEATGLGAHPLRVSVNLSGHQLRDRVAVAEVGRLLTETGLDPNLLALEITETVLMEASETPVDALHDLQALGVRLVLDDFGTGYSSLSYLRRLPLDTVKLDRAFVAGLTENRADREIVAAVLQMAAALDIAVVAEGVETETRSPDSASSAACSPRATTSRDPCPWTTWRRG